MVKMRPKCGKRFLNFSLKVFKFPLEIVFFSSILWSSSRCCSLLRSTHRPFPKRLSQQIKSRTSSSTATATSSSSNTTTASPTSSATTSSSNGSNRHSSNSIHILSWPSSRSRSQNSNPFHSSLHCPFLHRRSKWYHCWILLLILRWTPWSSLRTTSSTRSRSQTLWLNLWRTSWSLL